MERMADVEYQDWEEQAIVKDQMEVQLARELLDTDLQAHLQEVAQGSLSRCKWAALDPSDHQPSEEEKSDHYEDDDSEHEGEDIAIQTKLDGNQKWIWIREGWSHERIKKCIIDKWQLWRGDVYCLKGGRTFGEDTVIKDGDRIDLLPRCRGGASTTGNLSLPMEVSALSQQAADNHTGMSQSMTRMNVDEQGPPAPQARDARGPAPGLSLAQADHLPPVVTLTPRDQNTTEGEQAAKRLQDQLVREGWAEFTEETVAGNLEVIRARLETKPEDQALLNVTSYDTAFKDWLNLSIYLFTVGYNLEAQDPWFGLGLDTGAGEGVTQDLLEDRARRAERILEVAGQLGTWTTEDKDKASKAKDTLGAWRITCQLDLDMKRKDQAKGRPLRPRRSWSRRGSWRTGSGSTKEKG